MTFRATYRLQLRAGLDFDDVAGLAEYLADLGVSHVYCSPILQAVQSSTHGYDVVDPRVIDPTLGGEAGYTRMTAALRDHGLGQLLDIVPNHMATDPGNPWWWDVLANGPSSRYARFFDIDWEGPSEASWSKVLVPSLGDHYGRVLEDGELELTRHGTQFEIRYHEHRLPVSPESSSAILSPAARRSGSAELAEVADQLRRLPTTRGDTTVALERHHQIERAADRLEQLLNEPDIAPAVDAETKAVSTDIERLHDLLDEQNYRLAHWKTANEEIDYRRFFSIETLIGVRVDEPRVFDETHRLVIDLVRDGSVDGLRIDHIDGIRRPSRYLSQLSEATDGVYTVVEKILEEAEDLPSDWPVAGTTGYDFLNRVNSVFVDPLAEQRMTETYAEVTGEVAAYSDVLHHAKRQILETSLLAELQHLTGILDQICSHRRRHRDHTRRALRSTLTEVIAAFPVYRLYVSPGHEPSAADIGHITTAIAEARRREPEIDEELLELVTDLSLGKEQGALESEFVGRFQQLTAPVMAKGAEDTAFYRYNRLLSLNEVGGDPAVFGIDVDTFHGRTAEMAQQWPHTMLTIGTHDTKRSADVRARLNVLSEIAQSWEAAVLEWSDLVRRFRVDGWEDPNTEYHFFQSLVGAWPIDTGRLVEYMLKAVREAKVHTSWASPDSAYEAAVERLVTESLADEEFSVAVEKFITTEELVSRGRANSVRQVALLLTCPGVPDIYQGSELWDLSLVDPDNRRPVDFSRRREVRSEIAGTPWSGMTHDAGVSKLWLTQRLLGLRKRHGTPERYEPLPVRGKRAEEVLAYISGDVVAVIPLRSDRDWAETSVDIPAGQWHSLLSDQNVEGSRIDLSGILGSAPLAILSR